MTWARVERAISVVILVVVFSMFAALCVSPVPAAPHSPASVTRCP